MLGSLGAPLRALALFPRTARCALPQRRLQRRPLHATPRAASKSASSQRWLQRQRADEYTQRAVDDRYRSRAAYKLLEIDHKYKLFRPGMTVVDLGYAPGAWSQVAYEKTRPYGRVVGVDLLPLDPPHGVSALQGNFLSSSVRADLVRLLRDPAAGRHSAVGQQIFTSQAEADAAQRLLDGERARYEAWQKRARKDEAAAAAADAAEDAAAAGAAADSEGAGARPDNKGAAGGAKNVGGDAAAPLVDVVLSDMCVPSTQTTGFWNQSTNYLYYRLANTTGLVAADHAASVDLVDAALVFALDHLKPGGAFVCKFYTGAEDRLLEKRLQKVFAKVSRVKPKASRAASREMYFVARSKKRRPIKLETVFPDEEQEA